MARTQNSLSINRTKGNENPKERSSKSPDMNPKPISPVSGGEPSGSGLPPPSSPETDAAAEAVVSDLVTSLGRRRLYREVTLALRSGLREARADFSFLRTRGLRGLIKFLQSVACSDESVRLFRHSQTIPELQVIPVLFQNTLSSTKDNPSVTLDHVFGVDPVKINSPATDNEVSLALRVLEGCCLMYSRCASQAQKFKAIKVLVNILSIRGELAQAACLDALISLMLDSSINQKDFDECHGLERVADILKDEDVDENIRLKCGEFLLILIGHVHGKENSPIAHIHEDIKQLFGEKCASLIWAASQFGSTLDPDQRQTALQIQARRVLESLEIQ
ncbi:Impaired sucrose induction 1-like protein [Rhynchospora pubera]|uniref:Impaired sucrose induction 1-like protein n=2 Tax=Rhynchospora pubera TaxID=906938 RepID=A0AAV8GPZ0_9POAL|nr:Impaired sucrose induction 1-like protein [Rhynchospora pubera]